MQAEATDLDTTNKKCRSDKTGRIERRQHGCCERSAENKLI